jgi:hypothetical protein
MAFYKLDATESNDNHRTFTFDKEGVVINIPTQNSGITIIPQLLDAPWMPGMRTVGDFNPNRLVINFEFVDEKDPGIYLVEFDPPIEVVVYYTLGDRSFAEKDKKPIAIAYWKDDRWKLIDRSAPHSLSDISPILSESWSGLLRFYISTWGEPTIALGS